MAALCHLHAYLVVGPLGQTCSSTSTEGRSRTSSLVRLSRTPSADVFDGTYRDGNSLLAPEVAFVEEHMGDAMVAWVDDQPLDAPDGAVGGEHVLTPAHLHLAQGHSVIGDHYGRGQRPSSCPRPPIRERRSAAEPVIGPRQHLVLP